ncbi:metallophosphoesterase [Companilactobacillus ginsenosidimutans]|uniref:Calcineurin-like phosphoesterase domain-containing protein n=1 Tax=Companilactobacillus ginsenosidimutans TaxID=1007676 RepID=A0A0H4R184_9LACO|nr:metallophosphoesterase [Companilactobacillus ginsenosidimutans]AKP67465.1 hypothetical protein ABM34_07935 [Companilactobacillus ginsenosidimutans]
MGIFIALGDLHGQMETLDRLEIVQKQYPTAKTIFIGDYIDCYGTNLGFDLLHEIHDMQMKNPSDVIVLMGNHEQAAIDYFEDPENDSWLRFGGDYTLRAVAKKLGSKQDFSHDREFVLNHEHGLLDWVKQLPLTYYPGSDNKIVFTHAGLDLLLDDPIRDTSQTDHLWMRATYWYNPNFWGIFGHNKLDMSIVTGHTPTGNIMGEYEDDERPKKQESNRNPIYAIHYPGEYPRYLIDGGAGDGDSKKLGNIGVFDGETGMLIDAIED